jgi:hypothetical protein
MGKASYAIKAFIESIPDDKLIGLKDPDPTYSIYNTTNFRLDNQNVGGTPLPFQSIIVTDLLTLLIENLPQTTRTTQV